MEPQQKHLSPWIAWGLVILAFGVALFCIWYYYFQVGVAYENSTTDFLSLKKKTGTTASTTAVTDNTQKYTNTKYGYSVSYPKTGWYIYDENSKKTDNEASNTINFAKTGSSDRSYYVEVSSTSLQTRITNFEELAQESTHTNYQKKTVTFAGQSATQITWTDSITGNNKAILFSKGDYTYAIVGGGTDFETAISTLQFTK
jgi:hypothetical protein